MKVLVIGGMHGNEPLGIELVQLINRNPIRGVDAILANKRATAADVRFTGVDLNRTFPGNSTSDIYEEKRAASLIEKAKSYDVVLDFHNTHCPDNDCGFVGETASLALYAATKRLGLRRVIVADYDCLNKYAPNCLSVEISLSSKACEVATWHARISALAQTELSLMGVAGIERYRFVYRMTLEDRDRLELDKAQLRAFRQLPSALANAMGVSSPAYPIFVGDQYTPYNYGGLLNKINKL